MLPQEEFSRNGFAMLRNVRSTHELGNLLHTFKQQGVFNYNFTTPDEHDLLRSISAAHQMATSPSLMAMATSILGPQAQPFYAIMLDKTRTSNWGLNWHQDLKIAVKSKIDTPGYTNWSLEAGIWHVVPPASILQSMLTIRLHLDDCDDTNGAIWAIQGSHNEGIIADDHIADVVSRGPLIDCHAKAGDVMLMSPLLLHKSPYSVSDKPRRVLQIEYRAATLHHGLEWYK